MRPDIKRSESEVHVDTPLELAGAEEGAGELERAIGKAKALGRKFGHLQRQLARTREAMRRFHLAHPRAGGHGGEKDAPEKNEERKEKQERKEMRNLAAHQEAGKGAFHRRSAPRGQSEHGRMEDELSRGSVPMSPDAAGGNDASVETTSPRPETDALTDGQEQSGTGATESQATDWPAAEQSDEEQEEGQAALPASAAEEQPAAAGWNAEAMRGVIEQIAREAVQQGETAQAQRQDSRDESRMAAVETRLRNLEQRLSTGRDL